MIEYTGRIKRTIELIIDVAIKGFIAVVTIWSTAEIVAPPTRRNNSTTTMQIFASQRLLLFFMNEKYIDRLTIPSITIINECIESMEICHLCSTPELEFR